MNIFKFSIKLIAQIFFVIIFFSTLNAKNVDKFDYGQKISDYFSGILLLNDNKYNESYKFLRKLEGLEQTHVNYSSKYLLSLVNLGKFSEAFKYSKELEKKNLNNFESDLIVGTYYLKNKNFELAQKYFLKLKKNKSNFILNNFVSNSLLNWISFNDIDFEIAKEKIKKIDSRFENLKKIQNVFLHCFYKDENTEIFFENLVSNSKTDFSRYNYFYAAFLESKGEIDKAKKIINSSLKLYPRNLLLNQFKLDLDFSTYKNNFNCENLSHIIAEIYYITANALSTQNFFVSSNFYLNLAKFLNNDFHSFNNLLAENFYKIDNFKQAKKIYKNLSNQGEAYFWYSNKQITKILIEEDKKQKAIKLMENSYNQLRQKNIYETYDYARFLKNNEKYEDAINFYSSIIKKIKKDHPLYPKLKDGRGVAYERLGEWDRAEKDLLSSLDANPNQAYVINYLAYSWVEKGINIEKSLKMLKKANDLKPNDPFIIDSLGWALFKLRKYEDSQKYLQSAVKLMPEDPTINDHYGDVMWKNENRIQARYHWNYVLGLEDTDEKLKKNINNKLISGL